MISAARVNKATFVSAPSAATRSHSASRIAAWQSTGVTKQDIVSADGGRMVVQIDSQKVLLTVADDTVYAVSNKCTHLNLPLVGKTAMMQGEIKDGCIVCPAHGTAFDVKDGSVKGTWCPNFPDLPLVGKMTKEKNLPTFASRLGDSGTVEVDV